MGPKHLRGSFIHLFSNKTSRKKVISWLSVGPIIIRAQNQKIHTTHSKNGIT